MSNIVINDLEMNLELDQQALSALTGGSYYRKNSYFYKEIFVFKKIRKEYGYCHKPKYFKPVKLYFIEPYYCAPYKNHYGYGYGSYC